MALRRFQFLLGVFLTLPSVAMDRDVVVLLISEPVSDRVLEALTVEKPEPGEETIAWIRWSGAFTSNLDAHASLAILLSGETSQNNGVLDFRGSLYTEKWWLPDAFADVGYRVGILSASPVLERNRSGAAINNATMMLRPDTAQDVAWVRESLSEERPLFLIWDAMTSEDPRLVTVAIQSALETLIKDNQCRARMLRALWVVVGMGMPSEGEQVQLILGNWGPLAEGVDHAWVELLDVAPTLVRFLGVEIPSHIRGIDLREVMKRRHSGHEAVYFRWWNHLGDGKTPAHVGIRTKTQRLVFHYGSDYREREGMVEDEESFLTLMAATKTPPYWTWENEVSRESCEQAGSSIFRFEQARQLKHQMLGLRLILGETDRNFPHIAGIWEQQEEEAPR